MKKPFPVLMLILGLTIYFVPAQAPAATLLVEQTDPHNTFPSLPNSGDGYGLSDWTGMTLALNNAFGAGNITVSKASLDNLGYLLSFDRLWITPPKPGGSLSSLEIANLRAFIATGRGVIMVGENNNWSAWNASILQSVGGTYTGLETSDTPLTPVLTHPLTAGVPLLTTDGDGLAVGGTPLFNENVATLWGDQQNVLSLLSISVIDDYFPGVRNEAFKVNMAEWLVAVPEPSSLAIVWLGGAAIAFWKARKFIRRGQS